MSNAIVPFQFENFNVRIQQDANGTPWFNANDVCEALEFGNPRQAIESHADSEDVQKLDTLTAGGKQSVTHINESGVYALVMGSTKESAKRFKRWITAEVLPSIRKTGSYGVPPQQKARARAIPNAMRDQVSALLLIGKAMSKVKGVNEALAMACTLDAIERTTDLPALLLTRALPTVAPEETATLNATQVGEQLHLNARATNLLLDKMGLHYRDDSGHWKLTEAGTAFGEMKPFHRQGHSGYEVRWKQAVVGAALKYMEGMEKAA